MSKTYFINSKHKKNYEHLTTMVLKQAKQDPEYHAAAYILSLPEIYDNCIHDPMLHEYPFLWKVEYVDKSYIDYDEEYKEDYRVVNFDIKKDDEGNNVESEAYGTLSSGYKHIVKLGQNLFNSNFSKFNLMAALGTWDDELFKVYQQAVQIRIDRVVR